MPERYILRLTDGRNHIGLTITQESGEARNFARRLDLRDSTEWNEV